MGNLIALKKGAGKNKKKVALVAHMDEIGLLVKRVDKGFIDFSKFGGIDDSTLLGQRITIHGKEKIPGIICSKSIFFQKKEEREKPVKKEDLFIDIGAIEKKKKKGAKKDDENDQKTGIEKGTPITFNSQFMKLREHIYCGKSLDDRLGVYCLIDVLKRIKTCKNDLYCVFSTQEEVGLKGARVAAYGINPDLAISIDVIPSGDIPPVSKKESEIALGKGVGISLYEADGRGTILPESVKKFMMALVKKHRIDYQFEIAEGGLTEAAIMQLVKEGLLCCSIGPPVRNLHTPNEIFDERDLEATIRLTEEMAKNWK
jgi:endoglucanase